MKTPLHEAVLLARLDPLSNFQIKVHKDTPLNERIRLRFGLSGEQVSITELTPPWEDFPRYEIRVLVGVTYAG